MLGLSDRALAEAREGSAGWPPMTPAQVGAVRRPAIAVGSAFVVAGTSAWRRSAAGSDGGSGSGVAGLPAAPERRERGGQAALTEFAAECFERARLKLDRGPRSGTRQSQQYRAVDAREMMAFYAVAGRKEGIGGAGHAAGSASWAVADWSDAVAGRVTHARARHRHGRRALDR